MGNALLSRRSSPSNNTDGAFCVGDIKKSILDYAGEDWVKCDGTLMNTVDTKLSEFVPPDSTYFYEEINKPLTEIYNNFGFETIESITPGRRVIGLDGYIYLTITVNNGNDVEKYAIICNTKGLKKENNYLSNDYAILMKISTSADVCNILYSALNSLFYIVYCDDYIDNGYTYKNQLFVYSIFISDDGNNECTYLGVIRVDTTSGAYTRVMMDIDHVNGGVYVIAAISAGISGASENFSITRIDLDTLVTLIDVDSYGDTSDYSGINSHIFYNGDCWYCNTIYGNDGSGYYKTYLHHLSLRSDDKYYESQMYSNNAVLSMYTYYSGGKSQPMGQPMLFCDGTYIYAISSNPTLSSYRINLETEEVASFDLKCNFGDTSPNPDYSFNKFELYGTNKALRVFSKDIDDIYGNTTYHVYINLIKFISGDVVLDRYIYYPSDSGYEGLCNISILSSLFETSDDLLYFCFIKNSSLVYIKQSRTLPTLTADNYNYFIKVN